MMHQTLANASDGLGVGLFERQDLAELVAESLGETGRWHKKNCPLAAPTVMFFVLAMALFRSTSIKCLLVQLLGWLRTKAPRLSLHSVTPEAICHARERLGFEPLRVLFGKLAARIVAPASFFGLRVWATDGVHLALPDTPANDAEFGRPSSSRGTPAFPQMLVVALVETTSRLIRDIVVGRTNDPERVGCEQLLPHLGPGDLLLMDRGFAAVWLFARMMERNIHFLACISNAWKPEVITRLGPGDYLVRVHGPNGGSGAAEAKQRGGGGKEIFLTLRMIEYKIGENKRVRLLTDLVDRSYPALDLASLYHRRWECELSYDELKTHLATVNQGTLHTVLRSKSPDGIRQEVYGLFAVYNLVRELMRQAGEQHDVPPLEISFVETLNVIKNTLPEFERADASERSALIQRLLADIAECRLDRPRRARACPRVTKVKMSNWKLKRAGDRQTKVDFSAELRLCG